MSYKNKTIKEFILSDLCKADNIYDILDKCKNQSEKGFIYELLWFLAIVFNTIDNFPMNDYDIIISNMNNGKPKSVSSIQNYFENNYAISGNSSGSADITIRHKLTGKFVFFTCKYPKDDTEAKDIKYYGIQMIITIINDHKSIYKDYDIFTIVNNKNIVLNKIKRSKIDSIKKYLTDDKILDENDLCLAFDKMKKFVMTYDFDNYDNILMSNKQYLSHPFHQRLIIERSCQLIDEGSKTILWGCKPRSGKTYMAGGLIVNQSKKYDKYNVLIITPAPTETSPQFTDDLFEKYYDFDDFKVSHLKSSKRIKNMELDDSKNIIVISKQLLQMYIGENKIDFGKLNMIIFDENHFGGTSDLSEEIIMTYSSKKTIKIFLTATYNKPLQKWNIGVNERIFWDIEDEQFCKLNDWNSLVDKHGDCVNIVKKSMIKEGYVNILDEYIKYPEINIITTMFDSTKWDDIKDEIMESKYGFSMDTLFALKNKQFQYPKMVEQVMRYISGSRKEVDFKYGDKSMFTRIQNTCNQMNSRKPFTQLWFLPVNGINDISKCLKMVMMSDKILSKYDIFIVNSKSDEFVDDIKGEINKREIKAADEGKEGLIILAGNMLTLGITLPLCDVVFMLNDTISSDKVMQMMYRCMTEGKNKKCGIIVDMNINRVLQACISYNIHKKMQTTEEKIKYLVENHLINIDADLMNSKTINADVIIDKLLTIWKTDPINNIQMLLKQIENDIVEIDGEDQRALNKYFTESVGDKIKVTIKLKDEDGEDQEIKSGKEIISDDNDKKVVEKVKKISLTKDVLPFAIPLACILTMKDENNDFVKMLDTIANNNELLEVFDDQSYIWWNNKEIIQMIKRMTEKYIEKNSTTFNIAILIKMTIKSLIDQPEKLLEFIADRLKPKDVEKRKFGEVFTPMKTIYEMLDKLDESYIKTNGCSIFTNEELTWYDPATGMGNYPVAIYDRLMKGLSKKIPNEKKRKRHILENMLYMSELNKKNALICKQIFDIENKYKLNLYEGDSLTVDIKRQWNIKKFDVIIGNPPYNEELTKVGAKPLYHKFIEKYVDKCTYLTYIIPSRWFAGGKGLDKFRQMMLNRTDIKYIKHYDNAKKIFGNDVEINGGINYFLIDKTYEGLCNYNDEMLQLNKYDILVSNKYYGLIDKLIEYESLVTKYHGQGYFGITTNDNRLNNENIADNIKCYVSQQKGFIKYINENEIKNKYDFYKLATSRAYGAGDCFGNIFICDKKEICNQSYIFFDICNKKEAESLLTYLKCKLPNFMLSLRKISQDISESTCQWIPLVPLDREWTDEQIYKYFKLTNDEIKLIQLAKIKGFKENNNLQNIIIEEEENIKPKKKLIKKKI